MKIALDFGHGVEYDGGAVGIIQEESVINSVGPLVCDGLTRSGYNVILTRPKTSVSVYDSLKQRCDTANNNNADLFISIHANKFSKEAHGTEIFTYRGRKTTRSVNVLNNICKIGFYNRGIKDGTNLYVINCTSCEAMLIEICFIDNEYDVQLYKKDIENISYAIVNGIKEAPVSDIHTPDIVTPEPIINYIVQAGAFSEKENAYDYVERLKKAGFDAFVKKI